MNNYNEFIHTRTYSRFLQDKERREVYNETIDRWYDNIPKEAKLSPKITKELMKTKEMMLNLDTLPAMRTLWVAGPALSQNHIGAFNCAYTPIDGIESFAEILYILMHGTGVGISVEKMFINKLPKVSYKIKYHPTYTHIIEDSKEGWKDAVLAQTEALFDGRRLSFDYSRIREAGAPLKTFGGRASGPKPLQELLEFMVKIFDGAVGRKLTTLECFDIVCMVAQAVIVGGVRRSSLMCLTDIDDEAMKNAKNEDFYKTAPYRVAANISAVVNSEKEWSEHFDELFKELSNSTSGERGIINRGVINNKIRKSGRQVVAGQGVNPCAEILLRPRQFCNLSEIVMRKNDTLKTLKKKTESAVLFAVVQSQLTKYKNLSKEWTENAEEEKLIGVSITGIMDWISSNYVIYDDAKSSDKISEKINMTVVKNVLKAMKKHGLEYYNKLLDENPELAGKTRHNCIFTVKPSGTASQLVGSSSGIKPEHSKYYIRRVRVDAKDPLAMAMIESGMGFNYEVGQTAENATTYVFDFYRKSSSDERLTISNLSVSDQLEIYNIVNEYWSDHNPSATIAVGKEEWGIVKDFLQDNHNNIGGISFFPRFDAYYDLLPYEEITEEQYNKFIETAVDIDFSLLKKYEKSDSTDGAKTYACHAGKCEI